MWLGLVQSGEGLNTIKRLTLTQLKKFFLPINRDIGSFPTFRLELKHRLFLGLKPGGLKVGTTTSVLLVLRPSDTDWKESVGSPESPVHDSPCRSWDLPLYSCDQFLLVHLSMNPIGSVLWRMSTPCLCMLIFGNLWFLQCSCPWVIITSSQLSQNYTQHDLLDPLISCRPLLLRNLSIGLQSSLIWKREFSQVLDNCQITKLTAFPL